MILVDTSAWVEFDRATGSPVDTRLTSLVERGGPLAVTEPVIAEVLSGARSDSREHELRRLLARFTLLPLVAAIDFDGAVRVYRACRKAGVTPRGLIDCVISAVALRHGATLLAYDAHIVRI
ncbi:MAG: type II toxin-antitoxin system VapC family toxin, partial [Egibacteraceae bacterium]